MTNKHLTDKVDGYLTDEAKKALMDLIELGMDKDLAILFIETHCKDTEVYELPE